MERLHRSLAALSLFHFSALVVAQTCLINALPGNGSTSALARAPINLYSYGRAVYLIRSGELSTNGFAPATIPTAIGWRYTAAPGNVSSAPLKVYLQNTTDLTNLKSTDWSTAISGMTMVHNATTQLPATAGTFEVPFSGGSTFLYTGGSIYVAFDWGPYAGTLGTTAVIACNTALANGLLGAQGATAPTTLAASSFRPETHLRGAMSDAGVDCLYVPGSIPIGLVGPQVIQAVIKNRGSVALSNFPVTLTVTGANPFTNVKTISSLAGCGASTVVTFDAFTSTNIGTNGITVSIPNDGILVNNSRFRNQSVTLPTYDYKFPGMFSNGGLGFNGGTGAFVAQFTTNAETRVTHVNLEFMSTSATTYKIAIYGANGSAPGTTPLYIDASDRSVTAAGATSIQLPSPVTVGPGAFYVGLHQTNTTNAQVAYETESPLRPGVLFYTSLIPVTNWYDLGTVGGYKLNIGVTLDRCNLTPSATIAPEPFCPGHSDLQLTGSASAVGTWNWTGPAGFTSALQSPTIPSAPVTAAGIYTLTVNGCATGASVTATAGPTDGTACSDDDPCTLNDTYQNCVCTPGVPSTIDSDGDGIPDCTDPCPNVAVGGTCDDGNPFTTPDMYNSLCQCLGQPMGLTLNTRAFLEGAYVSMEDRMRDSLRSTGFLPTTEPYTALGYDHAACGGGEQLLPTILAVTGEDAIVDWVVLELRNPTDPGKVVASRSALLQRDGDIVDVNGLGPVVFCVPDGRYHVAVRHRNHLGIMTAVPVTFTGTPFDIDFTSTLTATWQNQAARKSVNGRMLMWAGDVTFNGIVQYTGSGNDRDPILIDVGGSTPNNVVTGYRQSDVNLDSRTVYTGTGNDRDPVLVNVGGATPNNVRKGYLPTDTLRVRPRVHVVDSLAWVIDTVLSDIDSTGLAVYAYVGGAPDVIANDVLVGLTGDGYMRLVDSVFFAANTMTCHTSPATLSDIFETGTVALDLPLADTTESSGFAPSSNRSFSTASSISIANGPGIDVSLNDIVVSATSDPVLTSSFGGFVPTAEVSWNSHLRVKGTLSIAVNSTVELINKKFVLFKKRTVLQAGPIPIPVTLEGNLKCSFDAGFSTATSTDITVDLESDATLGFAFVGGAWTPIFGLDPSLGDISGTAPQVTVNGAATLKLQLELTAKILGVVGPYFRTGPQADIAAHVNATATPVTYDVGASTKWVTELGIEANVLENDGDAFGQAAGWDFESAPLASWKYPDRLYVDASTNGQIGEANSPLEDSIAVYVGPSLYFLGDDITEAPPSGSAASGIPVHFDVLSGGGSVSPTVAISDALGRARCKWTLGSNASALPQRLKAWGVNGTGDTLSSSAIHFQAFFDRDSIFIASGDGQWGAPGNTLPQPLVARVVDGSGQPLAGHSVHFIVDSGGGSVAPSVATTDADGYASTSWTLGSGQVAEQRISVSAQNANGDPLRGSPRSVFATLKVPFNNYTYSVVSIGGKLWFAENLRTNQYRNGDLIDSLGLGTGGLFPSATSGAYMVLGNRDPEIYGLWYNWYAVNDPRGLCPNGWHIPSDVEWTNLELSLGLPASELGWTGRGVWDNIGGRMKTPYTWNDVTFYHSNTSGFTALRASGWNDYNSSNGALFWSSSQFDAASAWIRAIRNSQPVGCEPNVLCYFSGVWRQTALLKYGYSCRCIQD